MALFNQTIQLAVCGLHLKGFPLELQLLNLDAVYQKTTLTAPCYSLYTLNTDPPKPGLVRQDQNGSAIEVDIWELSFEALGKFLSEIPSPLTLGKVKLPDGNTVTGFLCEPYALSDAVDISYTGGWRYYGET